MVTEVFWMCALTPLFTRCCMVSAGMIYVQLCDDLIRFLQCSHEKGNAKELAPSLITPSIDLDVKSAACIYFRLAVV